MSSFKLGEKTYTLRLTYGVRQRILDTTGIDLAGDFEKVYGLPRTNLTACCNVIFQWIKTEFGGDESSFADLIDGDTLEAAHAAVVEAVIDFFPKEKRPTLREIVETQKKADREMAKTALIVMDREQEKMIKNLGEASIESLTTLLESLGSPLKTSQPEH